MDDLDSLRDSLQDSLQDSLRDSLQDSLRDSLQDSLRDSLQDSLQDWLSAQQHSPGQPAWWQIMNGEMRHIHYNREKKCAHRHKRLNTDSPIVNNAGDMDPYFSTPHMEPCTRATEGIKACLCQMCAEKIGIPLDDTRGSLKKALDETRV